MHGRRGRHRRQVSCPSHPGSCLGHVCDSRRDMRGMRPRLGRGGPSPPASWQGALASVGEALKPEGAGRNKIRLGDYGVSLHSTLHSERDKDPLVTRTGWTEKEEEEENIGGRPGRRVEDVTPRSQWRVSPFASSPSPTTAARRTECGPSSCSGLALWTYKSVPRKDKSMNCLAVVNGPLHSRHNRPPAYCLSPAGPRRPPARMAYKARSPRGNSPIPLLLRAGRTLPRAFLLSVSWTSFGSFTFSSRRA
jgi:hypothetical protein